jgi:hypothetical protein
MAKKNKNSIETKLTSFHDILAPTAMEFKTKSLIMGSQHQAIMTITDYPTTVKGAWLSDIIQMPGVITSIHIDPTDANDLIKKLTVAMGEYQAKLIGGGDAVSKRRAEKGYMDAEVLLKKIDEEQHKIIYCTVILNITADDEEQLKQRIRNVEAKLGGSHMRGRTLTLLQEDGLKMAAPWCRNITSIKEIGSRNMTTETLAASYPFVYSGINDGVGILLGNDRLGGVVLIDFWIRKKDRTNSNITAIGRPGVGKSTAIKKLLTHEFKEGTKIIILDPEREYKDFCKKTKGAWIDCGGGIKGRINPLEIRSIPDEDNEDDEDTLYSKEIIQKGALAIHIQTLRIFFRMYLGELTRMQKALLEIALEDLYIKQFNITWDTDPKSVTIWPTMNDLYELMFKKISTDEPEWKELAYAIRAAAIGADAPLWNGQTTIKTDNQVTVLDIHNLIDADKNIRGAQYYNILSWAWDVISRDRNERVVVVVDEAYLLADKDVPEPLVFLRNTSKRCRKYEGAIWVIFHNLIDFMDESIKRYGQALVDNPIYKIIMGQGDKDIEALTQLMELSDKEVTTLQKGERGAALLVVGNRRVEINIEVFRHEEEFIGAGGGR